MRPCGGKLTSRIPQHVSVDPKGSRTILTAHENMFKTSERMVHVCATVLDALFEGYGSRARVVRYDLDRTEEDMAVW